MLWRFFVIGCLAFIYTTLVYVIVNPKVSNEYHEYYISRISGFSPIGLDNLLAIQKSVEYIHGSEYILFEKDWWSPKKEYLMNSGLNVSFAFKVMNSYEFEGVLVFKLNVSEDQFFIVYLNDIEIYAGEIDSQIKFIEITLENEMLKNGKNVISFSFSKTSHTLNNKNSNVVFLFKSFMIN